MNPDLPPKFTTPVPLTQDSSASGIKPLFTFTGGLLFSKSSLTSPNDVFMIRDLKQFETEVLQSDDVVSFKGKIEQVTRLTESALKGKALSQGEEFWFKGANQRDVQGWVLKPGGLKDGDKKKWPIVLLIHGGALVYSHCPFFSRHRRSTGGLGGSMVD